MTETPAEAPPPEPADPTDALRKQLDIAHQRLIQSELKAYALRAGIIDLDGLKLMDTSALKLDDKGNLPDPTAALATLKRDKPWLFARANSSQPATAPAPEPPKTRMAREMTHEEWQAARSRLVRGR